MTTDRQPPRDRAEDGQSRLSDRMVAFLVIEGTALAIGLVSPITPSKTGSTWSPAELVTPDPNYLQKVIASFVLVNGLVVVLGLVVWVSMRFGGSE